MTQRQSTCTDIEPLLDAFADNELTADERPQVERHLSTCPACQNRLAQTERLKQSLRALPELAPGRDLIDEMPDLTARRPRSVLAFAPIIWASVAIAASALLLLLVFKGLPAANRSAVADLKGAGQTNRLQRENSVPERVPARVEQACEAPEVSHSEPAAHQKHHHKQAGEIAVNHPDSTGKDNKGNLPAIAEKRQPEQKETGGEEPGSGVEVATLDEVGHSTITGAIGISTDEDGLYAIKM